jgi:hypothetical protein
MTDIIVNLEDIIEGLEFQSYERRSFLNLRNGEVVSIADEEFRAAEDEELIEKFPDWQRDNIKLAQEILEESYFIALPSHFEIHEYSIMEEFCLEIEDDNISNILYNSIKGRGAFRRFKDKIRRFGIEEEWYKYRDEAIKRIAIEWCEENEINYK